MYIPRWIQLGKIFLLLQNYCWPYPSIFTDKTEIYGSKTISSQRRCITLRFLFSSYLHLKEERVKVKEWGTDWEYHWLDLFRQIHVISESRACTAQPRCFVRVMGENSIIITMSQSWQYTSFVITTKQKYLTFAKSFVHTSHASTGHENTFQLDLLHSFCSTTLHHHFASLYSGLPLGSVMSETE